MGMVQDAVKSGAGFSYDLFWGKPKKQAPKPPPLPAEAQTPDAADEAVQGARAAARRKQQAAGGRSSSFLTGPYEAKSTGQAAGGFPYQSMNGPKNTLGQ